MKTYQDFTTEAYRFAKRPGLKYKDPFTKYDPGVKPTGSLGGEFQGGWLKKEKEKKDKK